MSTIELDARRLFCPLPVIRLQDQVALSTGGDHIRVTCTDPGALNDIPAWCRINGHRVVASTRDGNDIIIEVEVGDG